MPSKLKPEEQVQVAYITWFGLQYPKHRQGLFTNILAGGMYLSPRQGHKFKMLGAPKSWPDIIIDVPNGVYHGLRIELKAEGVKLQKKDGSWKDEHVEAQAKQLEYLRGNGFYAEFAVGIEEAMRHTNLYFGA